jgi:hypothetical protein
MTEDKGEDRKPKTTDSNADRPVDRVPLKPVIKSNEGRQSEDLRRDPDKTTPRKKG